MTTLEDVKEELNEFVSTLMGNQRKLLLLLEICRDELQTPSDNRDHIITALTNVLEGKLPNGDQHVTH